VRPLGFVELQRPRDPFEDVFGDAAGVAALESRVVLDADASEHRGLLAAQSLHSSPAAIVRETGLLRGDLRSPRGEELPDVVPTVHGSHATSVPPTQGVPASTPIDRDSLGCAARG